MRKKMELWRFSPLEFGIMYILSQAEFSLNAYQIHKDLLIRNIGLLDVLLTRQQIRDMEALAVVLTIQHEGIFRLALPRPIRQVKKDLVKMIRLYQEGGFSDIRSCEKIMRKYLEMPTYDRIVRILKHLKREGMVLERQSGKGMVWGVPPEIKKEVLEYPAKNLLPKYKKEINKMLPEFMRKSP